MVVIKGMGCILGQVSSIESGIAWDDKQNVNTGTLLDSSDLSEIDPERRSHLPITRSFEAFNYQTI
jgi:hypothetical protein